MSENKKYILVLSGIVLCAIGGLLYITKPKKIKSVAKIKREQIKQLLANNSTLTKENNFKPCVKPTKLNQTFDNIIKINSISNINNKYNTETIKRDFNTTIKLTFEPKINKRINKYYKIIKTKIVRGNLYLSKGNLEYLKPNTDIVGDVYINNIDRLKIPYNVRIAGNIYLNNSKGLTFVGNNIVTGHIFVEGVSSIKTLPESSFIKGQIFI